MHQVSEPISGASGFLASTINEIMINDSSKIFEMSLATDGVAEFGDWGRRHQRRL